MRPPHGQRLLFETPNLYNALKFNPVYAANHAKTRLWHSGFIYLCHICTINKTHVESEQLLRNCNCDTFFMSFLKSRNLTPPSYSATPLLRPNFSDPLVAVLRAHLHYALFFLTTFFLWERRSSKMPKRKNTFKDIPPAESKKGKFDSVKFRKMERRS